MCVCKRMCSCKCVGAYVCVYEREGDGGEGDEEGEEGKEGGKERYYKRWSESLRIQSQVPLMPTQLCSTKAILGSTIFLQVH